MEAQECILFIVAPDRVHRCQQYEIHLTLHLSARYFLSILTKFGSPRPILMKVKLSNFTKIRPVGAELTRPDRRTDKRTDVRKGRS